MRRSEIEYWALQAIDQAKAGRPYEDSRVELKADWIAPPAAARRIAAHANAAGAEPILWLIGVDEKRGPNAVVGAAHADLASWYPEVQKYFDGLAPRLTDTVLPLDGTTVSALYFETDGAPYVVKNAAFGQPGGGSVEREVPWREGAKTRSATHNDLIRLLVPQYRRPTLEVIEAELQATDDSQFIAHPLAWHASLEFFITWPGEQRLVFPSHRAELTFEVPGRFEETRLATLLFLPYKPKDEKFGTFTILASPPTDYHVSVTASEIVAHLPGRARISGAVRTARPMFVPDPGTAQTAVLRLKLPAEGLDNPATLTAELPHMTDTPGGFQWTSE